jgi:hypothetical protein
MTQPRLSVVIPTTGRPSLGLLLNTIPDDHDIEVLLVGDTHGDDFSEVIHLARVNCGSRWGIRWIEHDGGLHAWGHPQRNRGIEEAQGEYIVFSQDDNVFSPDAFDAIRGAISDQPYERPLLFQVMTWQAGIVWKHRGLLKLGEIDADCIVVPNHPQRLGRWTSIYNGDWDFIKQTYDKWEGDVAWRDDLIASALPGIERHPE